MKKPIHLQSTILQSQGALHTSHEGSDRLHLDSSTGNQRKADVIYLVSNFWECRYTGMLKAEFSPGIQDTFSCSQIPQTGYLSRSRAISSHPIENYSKERMHFMKLAVSWSTHVTIAAGQPQPLLLTPVLSLGDCQDNWPRLYNDPINRAQTQHVYRPHLHNTIVT